METKNRQANGKGTHADVLSPGIDRATAKLLENLGIILPFPIKEIATETEHSETNKILLPVGMSKLDAAHELERQWENEETQQAYVLELKDWYYKDVLVIIKRVTEREFGWMNATAGGFFTPPPHEIDVVTNIVDGNVVSEKAFYGEFRITAWENAKSLINFDRQGNVTFSIYAKKKYTKQIDAYFALLRTELQTASIFKGKSIVVTNNGPKGLDFSIIENKPSNKIILNDAERRIIDSFILPTIDKPGKRCYLFTGDYGNGKTETAMQVGRYGNDKGLSFMYIKDAQMFDQALNLAKQYQPCMIFVEDIDEIASGDERDAFMNKILNTLDGVQTKGNNLTVMFTTNHPKRINSALRRPGRIDMMIKFKNPDVETRKKIIKLYLGDKKGFNDLDLDQLAKLMPDAQGAVIAEICNRAVQLADRDGEINQDSFSACIHSMEYQMELMNEAVDMVPLEQQYFEIREKLTQKYN